MDQTFTVAGDVSTFDSEAVRTAMLAAYPQALDAIVTATAGSVNVDVRYILPDLTTAQAVQTNLAAATPSSIQAALPAGLTVSSVDPPSPIVASVVDAPSPPTTPSVYYGPEVNTAHLIHGLLMVIAWGFLAPFGSLLPRMKWLLPKGQWFKLHWKVQGLAILLSTIGLIVVIPSVEPGYHFSGTHKSIGLVVSILALVQPAIAYFRPDKPNPGEAATFIRNLWRFKHAVLGCTLLGLTLWQVLTGVTYTYGLDYLVTLYILLLAGALLLGGIGIMMGLNKGDPKGARVTVPPGAKGTEMTPASEVEVSKCI